ncbi:hypothetical protein [Salibacterium salarium]|uniref:Uncharacterized protein n=1 Tax=Salibacterium salarium TaxID=284579 RepID=A0A3R9QGW1_9BACI|nr:hypothetical protein [Salibacterium salarium]RSL30270.1 hypothetical protein D7Z54_27090 [Salibacterium salarium]
MIGLLLVLWGVILLYVSLYKGKTTTEKDEGIVGVSGFIEWEFLFKLLHKPISIIIMTLKMNNPL